MIGRGLYRGLVRSAKVLSRRGLYPFLEAQFGAIPAGSRVLSVGSGGEVNARLLHHAAARGFDVLTFDIDPARSPDVLGDICTYDFTPGEFDVVVICEVLEHLYAPHEAVRRLHAALRPGGRLVLTVPFLLPIHERPHDYFRYTRYGLAYLLREFTDVDIRERNTWAEAAVVVPVRLVNERGIGRLVSPLFVLLGFALAPFAWLTGRLVRTDFATTGYVVAARRGAAE